jgi:hypothetical protein
VPALSDYSNVYGTALQVLQDKGYQIWFDPETNMFWAERDGWDFASESPCGLLGAVAIYEHRNPPKYQEYWWRKDEIDVLDLPRAPSPYRSILTTQGRGR